MSGLVRGSDAARCKRKGWVVGDMLAGDEGYGVTVILITAIGEESILAREISRKGVYVQTTEASWTLRLRDWKRVAKSPSKPPLPVAKRRAGR